MEGERVSGCNKAKKNTLTPLSTAPAPMQTCSSPQNTCSSSPCIAWQKKGKGK